MTPSRAGSLAVVGLAATVSALVTWWTAAPWIDGLFLAVVGSCSGLLLRAGIRAQRAAAAQQQWARKLAGTQVAEVADRAVREERRRLESDIAATLRQTLTAIEAEAAAALRDADPRPALARIRDSARMATAELRRRLGLLRLEEEAAEAEPPAGSPPRAGRQDLLRAAAVIALALAESLVYPRFDGEPTSVVSVALAGAVAATVVGWRTAPGPAALVAAGGYLLAVPLGAAVHGGFWFLAAVAGSLWTICARPDTSRFERGAAVALAVACLWSTRRLDPENLGFTAAALGVAAAGALIVRQARRRAAQAGEQAERREGQLAAAVSAALAADRTAIARELHDVISHAVGLVAVQAGAAEVSWSTDPAAARQSVAIIQRTAATARADLDRLVPRGPAAPSSYADLTRLVDRMRQAGTPVRLELAPGLPRILDPAAYRVVQEGLTNVLRHAPGATAQVALRVGEDGGVHVTVTDEGGTARPGTRGYGLVGLAERVQLAGGRFESGPVAGGFRVAAWLPAAVKVGP